MVSGTEWDYVALGDSRTSMTSYPDLYAVHIEADLDVKVILHNEAAHGQMTYTLRTQLRTDELLRVKVSEVEVVTIFTNGSGWYSGQRPLEGSCDSDVEDLGKNLDEIINEILSLRGRNKTIIRLIEQYQIYWQKTKRVWCFRGQESVHRGL